MLTFENDGWEKEEGILQDQIVFVQEGEIPIANLHQSIFNIRGKEKSRVQRLIKNIKRDGWMCGTRIIINDSGGIVDGYNRACACTALGIPIIPYVMLHFPNEKTEAYYFERCNSHNSSLKKEELWQSRYNEGEPIAKFIYLLEESPKSRFVNRIAIKGKYSPKTKFLISHVLIFINNAILGKPDHWEQSKDEQLRLGLKKIGEKEVMAKCNLMLQWFNECFGINKADNSIPFARHSLESLLYFYNRLKTSGYFNGNYKSYISVINKMQKFFFTYNFVGASIEEKRRILIDHFNKGKKEENKIKYSN